MNGLERSEITLTDLGPQILACLKEHSLYKLYQGNMSTDTTATYILLDFFFREAYKYFQTY
jgi:hypothetical protein